MVSELISFAKISAVTMLFVLASAYSGGVGFGF